MKKLFALEDEKTKEHLENNELLIDKVLNYSKKEASPLTVTADVIKQRQELKSEIVDQLNKAEDEEDKDESSDNEDSSDSSDNDSDSNSSGDADGGGDSDSNSDDKSDDKKSDSDKSDSDAADDKDSLNSLVGSGLKEDSGDSKDTPAEESFKAKVTLKNVFSPIRDSYKKYTTSLESFAVPFKLAIEEQPIVYVKESVLEALNNLVEVANVYIAKNKTFIDSNAESVKNTNERLTVLRQFVENRKYHFTNKLVNDQEVLANLAVTEKSDPRETVKYLLSYVESSSKFVNFILNNEFEKIASTLTNSNFIVENEDFVYKQMLPGFNLIRVHLDKYENYLKANMENFHYYKVKTFKTEDLYNLEAIAIAEDKELDFLMASLDKLLIDLSMTIDNFNVVNTNLNKLIDEIKVILFDVGNDKYTNLASIDVDSKVKDFIKFKLISETYYINCSLIIDYILNSISVINGCIELKQ